MHSITCPHCGNQRLLTSKVPKDVVVVLPCPSCHEWVVLFRSKVIALSREVIINGSFEEKKEHIAEVIAEFLEPGMLPSSAEELEAMTNQFGQARHPGQDENELEDDDGGDTDEEGERPISQREFDNFVKLQLKRIDDPIYFRKHFGP